MPNNSAQFSRIERANAMNVSDLVASIWRFRHEEDFTSQRLQMAAGAAWFYRTND
jgi:hypothetical protein